MRLRSRPCAEMSSAIADKLGSSACNWRCCRSASTSVTSGSGKSVNTAMVPVMPTKKKVAVEAIVAKRPRHTRFFATRTASSISRSRSSMSPRRSYLDCRVVDLDDGARLRQAQASACPGVDSVADSNSDERDRRRPGHCQPVRRVAARRNHDLPCHVCRKGDAALRHAARLADLTRARTRSIKEASKPSSALLGCPAVSTQFGSSQHSGNTSFARQESWIAQALYSTIQVSGPL